MEHVQLMEHWKKKKGKIPKRKEQQSISNPPDLVYIALAAPFAYLFIFLFFSSVPSTTYAKTLRVLKLVKPPLVTKVQDE